MPTVVATLVTAAVAVTVLSSCTLAAVAPTAQCSLVMRGYAQAPVDVSNPPQEGLKQMKLSCVSTPAGWKVPIGISKKHAQQYVKDFDGVQVLGNYSCQQKAGTQGNLDLPTSALLYFCGDYKITLSRPQISNIFYWGESDSENLVKCVLAFGANVQAVITEGQLVNNSAATVVSVMDTATVRIEGGTRFSSNLGVIGSGIWARHKSVVVIRDNIFSHNNSTVDGAGGGAMAVTDEANLTVIATDFVNNSATSDGGAFVSLDAAAVSFLDCKFHNNTAGRNGGAVWAAGEIVLVDTTMTGNKAVGDGGALMVNQTAHLVMSNSCSITGNSAGGHAGGAALLNDKWDIPALLEMVHGNKAEQGSNDLGVPPWQVMILGPRNLSSSGGQLPVDVLVTGAYSIPCTGWMIQAVLNHNFLASNLSDAQGIAHLMLSIRQPPGGYNVMFTLVTDGRMKF